MRIILYGIFLISCMACHTIKHTVPVHHAGIFSDLEIEYINKFMMENIILDPEGVGVVEPLFPLRDSLLDIHIVEEKTGYFSFSKEEWFNSFLEDSIILQVIPNPPSFGIKKLFLYYKPNIICIDTFPNRADLKKYLTDKLGKSSIAFHVGDIYKINTSYFIPVLYYLEYPEYENYYVDSRIFEFEHCTKGVINFKKLYYYLGFWNESYYTGHVFNNKILNETSCLSDN